MEFCFACHRPINGTSLVTMGKHYHQTCFRCSTCSAPLQGTFLLGNSGEPLCMGCKPKEEGEFNAKCHKCKTPISDTVVTAMGHKYHPGCFTCSKCNMKLQGTFSSHQEEPVCPDCYTKLQFGGGSSVGGGGFGPSMSMGVCSKCNGPITDGTVVTAINKKFHKSCFKCHDCGRAITGGFNSPNEEDVYCMDCYNKDFGKKCTNCHLPISDTEFTVFNGQNFHHSCFRCTICGSSMVGQPLGISNSGGVCCVSHTR